jgi:hypothetical protein
MSSAASGARRSSLANKKRRASAASQASAAPPQQQNQPPAAGRASMFVNTLRMVALLSATVVAVVVFELLQNSLGFWPALGIGFLAGIVARVAFVWLERVWLRAAARRALAHAAKRADQ